MSIFWGLFLGYLIASYAAGPEAGVDGRFKSIKLRFKNYIIHLHHWILASMTSVFLWVGDIERLFVYAFLFGIIAHGLTYEDFYRFIYSGES